MLCGSDVLGPGNITLNSPCLWSYEAYILVGAQKKEGWGGRRRERLMDG